MGSSCCKELEEKQRENERIRRETKMAKKKESLIPISGDMINLSQPFKSNGKVSTHKVVLIGNKGTGKSSIVLRYMKNTFDENHNVTIGASFMHKDMNYMADLDGGHTQFFQLALHLWDTAGEENYKNMTKYFFRDATVGIVVYDMSDRSTFEGVPTWIEDFTAQRTNAQLFLVGSKKDKLRNNERMVSMDEINAFLLKTNTDHPASKISHFECSARSNFGIVELFEIIGMQLMRNFIDSDPSHSKLLIHELKLVDSKNIPKPSPKHQKKTSLYSPDLVM